MFDSVPLSCDRREALCLSCLPGSLAHSKQQYYLSQQCVCVSLFHLPLPFDLKVNAAAFAFSVSPAFFSFTPLLASSAAHVYISTHERRFLFRSL